MCDPSEAMGFFGRLLVALGLAKKKVRPRIYLTAPVPASRRAVPSPQSFRTIPVDPRAFPPRSSIAEEPAGHGIGQRW